MEIIIKCPNCGHNLILNDEWGDSEYYNNEYLDYSTGYCEHCEKEFFITLIYKFDHFEIDEEIKDE